MLNWLISKLFSAFEPSTPKVQFNLPQHPDALSHALDCANALRCGKPLDDFLSSDFAILMARRKGWHAESMVGIRAYLKSLGFHLVTSGDYLLMVQYDWGISANLDGDTYGIIKARNEVNVCFRSTQPNEPADSCRITHYSGPDVEFSIDPVAKTLKSYKEHLEWFRNRRRR